MSKKVLRLTRKAKEDLDKVVAVPSEEYPKIASLYHEYTAEKIGTLKETETAITKATSISPPTTRAITNFIFFISDTEQSISDFMRELELLGFNGDEIKKLEAFIRQLEDKGVIEFFSRMQERFRIEDFGISRFKSIRFMADYRLMDSKKRQKTIIPIIICRLALSSGDAKEVLQEIVFQFTPDSLDEIESNIKDLRSKVNRDLTYMQKKLGYQGD